MEQDKPTMLRLISSAVSVANRAGAEVKRVMKSGKLGVIDKGIQDFQTEADRTAQRLIVASLSKNFPDCTIVGEEDLVKDEKADSELLVDTLDETILNTVCLPEEYINIAEKDITIWVDPLDGTAEFVKGFLEHVTVLIGISVNGKSVAGIIHQPYHGYTASRDQSACKGRTMWGLVGLGCFGIVANPLPNDKLIITTTASHGNDNIEKSIAAIKPDEVLKVGGAGHKVLLVIEGIAHSYVFTSFGCKRWDTSAPEAILKAAGGELTDSFGRELEYNYREDRDYQNYHGIIASKNSEIHSKIIGKIPDEVKRRLEKR